MPKKLCKTPRYALSEELGGDQPFTPGFLEELGKLVAADWVTYCEQDRVRERDRLSIGRSGDDWSDEPTVSYWEIADEHPVCSKHNTGDFRAFKLSDFLTLRQLRRSHVYDVWFRPAGTERTLSVAIPSPPWHTKTFIFERRRGADFTDRDRLVLNLLQPHLGRLWRAAQLRRRLRAALAALEAGAESESGGVVVLATEGRIEIVSPAALRLMGEYFGDSGENGLPAAVVEWLDSGSPTMRQQQGDRVLTVSRSGDTLVFEETRDELNLTAREREILAWVARGKTNPEISELLWIAPTTVRKHLENVYAKLGVNTRTAAAARFLGYLGVFATV